MSRGTVKVINETSEKKRRKKKALPRTLQHILLIPLQPILQSFNIRQIVTLVGRRSTVVGLVQRLWEGDVWVGGERLGEVDVKWLRDRLAIVTLFDTSVVWGKGR